MNDKQNGLDSLFQVAEDYIIEDAPDVQCYICGITSTPTRPVHFLHLREKSGIEENGFIVCPGCCDEILEQRREEEYESFLDREYVKEVQNILI